jgi:transposase
MRKLIAEKVAAGELTYREAAIKYNISHGSVHSWKQRHSTGSLGSMNPPPMPESDAKQLKALQDENMMLKQELGDLYLENRLLKKAADWVQLVKRESSSIITSESLNPSQEPVKP